MKHKFLILSCILLLFACRKEKIDDPNFIGKWVLVNCALMNEAFDVFTVRKSPNDTEILNSEKLGVVSLEIDPNGYVICESNFGVEKLKIISKAYKESSCQNYYFDTVMNTYQQEEFFITGYLLTLKTEDGGKVNFPLFYCKELDRMLTVPWIKGTQPDVHDRVYVARVPSDFSTNNVEHFDGDFNQVLGKFRKL